MLVIEILLVPSPLAVRAVPVATITTTMDTYILAALHFANIEIECIQCNDTVALVSTHFLCPYESASPTNNVAAINSDQRGG